MSSPFPKIELVLFYTGPPILEGLYGKSACHTNPPKNGPLLPSPPVPRVPAFRVLAFFSEVMTPSRLEQDAPLTPVTSQTTSGAECLGKYLGTGGEGNKGPFFGGFVWQADLPYNLSKMGAYV